MNFNSRHPWRILFGVIRVSVVGLGGVLTVALINDDPPTLTVRKNAKDLTTGEKQAFVNAVPALKASPPPDGITPIVVPDGVGAEIIIEITNHYDMFVAHHQAAVLWSTYAHGNEGVAHKNATFTPWNRKLLHLLERALHDVGGEEMALPYWDWTDDKSTAAVFSSNLMVAAGDPNCTVGGRYWDQRRRAEQRVHAQYCSRLGTT